MYASLRIAGFYEDFYHEYSFLDRKILQFELKKNKRLKAACFFYKGIVGRSPCRSIFALLFIPRHERLDVLDGFEDVGGEVDRLFLGDDDVVLDADADALLLNVQARLDSDDHAGAQCLAGWGGDVVAIQSQAVADAVVVVVADRLAVLEQTNLRQLLGVEVDDHVV